MQVTIIRVAGRDKQFEEIAQEYIKRLSKQCEIHTVKPLKNLTQQETIKRETHLVLDKLGTISWEFTTNVLQLWSSEYSSEEFSETFCGHTHQVFLIGGPYGFDYKMLRSSWARSVSFGNHTLPHGLAYVTLLEQLYRGWTLQVGKKYHY